MNYFIHDYSNLKPQVSAVRNSDSILGYFLQFNGRTGWIVQKDFPFGLYLRNWQTLGSLQHAPQLLHWPLRFLETANTEVKVLLVLADHVFFFSAIIPLLSQIANGHLISAQTKPLMISERPPRCFQLRPRTAGYHLRNRPVSHLWD